MILKIALFIKNIIDIMKMIFAANKALKPEKSAY